MCLVFVKSNKTKVHLEMCITREVCHHGDICLVISRDHDICHHGDICLVTSRDQDICHHGDMCLVTSRDHDIRNLDDIFLVTSIMTSATMVTSRDVFHM